jgi:hypothetical protein
MSARTFVGRLVGGKVVADVDRPTVTVGRLGQPTMGRLDAPKAPEPPPAAPPTGGDSDASSSG